jgi:hypothetical protein
MADYDDDEDFFEESEPAEKIHALFDQGEKGQTALPASIQAVAFDSDPWAFQAVVGLYEMPNQAFGIVARVRDDDGLPDLLNA